MKNARLNIWMNGLPVGYWESKRGADTLTYFEDWAKDEQGRPLSLSLPIRPGDLSISGDVVSAYFDNLLPDSDDIRARLALKYGTPSKRPFDMLAGLGRDCVGAIQLLPPEESPADLESIRGNRLSEADVARLLRSTVRANRLGQANEFDLRFSVAGAQEKTALLYLDGEWYEPHGSTPTTHLLKLPMGIIGGRMDMTYSIENEWLCSKLLQAFSLPVANSEIRQFEDQKVLSVERFDRKFAADHSWIVRLPQEDMCQATGTPPSRKYQKDAGPGMQQILDILQGAQAPQQARADFFKAQILFRILAATDGHAKNFSIGHLSGNTFYPTPLYDVISCHPVLDRTLEHHLKFAMSLRGTKDNYYDLLHLQGKYWENTARDANLPKDLATDLIRQIQEQLPWVCETVSKILPPEFPREVSDSIFAGMEKYAKLLSQ